MAFQALSYYMFFHLSIERRLSKYNRSLAGMSKLWIFQADPAKIKVRVFCKINTSQKAIIYFTNQALKKKSSTQRTEWEQ